MQIYLLIQNRTITKNTQDYKEINREGKKYIIIIINEDLELS